MSLSRRTTPVVLALCVATACETQQSAPVTPQPEASSGGSAAATPGAPSATMAHVRAIHASPDPLASSVVVYLDGSMTPVIPNLSFRNAVGYSDIPPGQHAVQVRLPGIPASTPPSLTWTTPVLQPDHTYTIIAIGLALEAPAVTFASEEDTATVPDPGHANVRFFHALVGTGAVDVCNATGTPLFANVGYGTYGISFADSTQHYVNAPSGTASLLIRQHAPGACSGRPLGAVDVSVVDRTNITLVATGREARHGAGAQSVPPQMLSCQDAPLAGSSASCTAIPINGMGGGR